MCCCIVCSRPFLVHCFQDNWDALEPARFFKLYHNDRFKFASSTRDYLIQDVSQCELKL
jgi:hypothetical protein